MTETVLGLEHLSNLEARGVDIKKAIKGLGTNDKLLLQSVPIGMDRDDAQRLAAGYGGNITVKALMDRIWNDPPVSRFGDGTHQLPVRHTSSAPIRTAGYIYNAKNRDEKYASVSTVSEELQPSAILVAKLHNQVIHFANCIYDNHSHTQTALVRQEISKSIEELRQELDKAPLPIEVRHASLLQIGIIESLAREDHIWEQKGVVGGKYKTNNMLFDATGVASLRAAATTLIYGFDSAIEGNCFVYK